MNLGNNISEKRKAKGMTQEELAANLGVSPQAVSKWENNLSCPDISLLPSIAKLFGMSVDELLGAAPATENIGEEKTFSEPETVYEEPVFTGKKATTLLITTERNGKVSNVRFPLTIMRFGLNLGSAFGGITGAQANTIENAVKTGLSGEILSVDGENGEKVTISLV
ncbi:MAG: helix-turn-helix transcriptional regulator [Ruminococcaceae bacterium]|nr:helix-turn-helix transcriptional regulator [Oscillospiraceae bacterium]